MTLSRRTTALLGGAPVLPLAVLFALNLVDELDRVAFGVLSPEIRDAFGLTDAGIVGIGAAAGVTSLVAALPLGVLADRVHRVRLAAVGAATWSSATVLTALSPTVWVLALARIVAGTGRIVNEPVHASLLADYYAPAVQPRVFALHRLANPLGLSSALLVGLLGAWLDWRAVFLLLAVPTACVLPLLLRLREPQRGVPADLAARLAPAVDVLPLDALPPDPLPPVPPRVAPLTARQARRRLVAVGTLRRTWVPLPVLGVTVIALPQLVTLFFEREYGFGPTGRGVVMFLSGVGIAVGLGVGQYLGTRALRQGRPELLARVVSLAVVGIGVGLAGVVLVQDPVLSALCYLLAGIGTGAYQPCTFTLTCMVAPPRLRGQAFAYAILLLGVGGLLSPLFAALGEASGYRAALGALAVVLVVGGLVLGRVVGQVRGDVAAAEAEALAEAAPPVPAG